MRTIVLAVGLIAATAAVAAPARADDDHHRAPALETNVLWPFFPGGISEFRLMLPVLASDQEDFRGELVLGTYADFAHRVVRKPGAAKTGVLAAKLGYRQFLISGIHVEATANIGWRRETERADGVTFDALQGRLWLMAGWQWELSRAFYFNTRAGFGTHLFRTDRFADEERIFVAGADLNLGVRF